MNLPPSSSDDGSRFAVRGPLGTVDAVGLTNNVPPCSWLVTTTTTNPCAACSGETRPTARPSKMTPCVALYTSDLVSPANEERDEPGHSTVPHSAGPMRRSTACFLVTEETATTSALFLQVGAGRTAPKITRTWHISFAAAQPTVCTCDGEDIWLCLTSSRPSLTRDAKSRTLCILFFVVSAFFAFLLFAFLLFCFSAFLLFCFLLVALSRGPLRAVQLREASLRRGTESPRKNFPLALM
jgi:hypothetical protein